VLFIATVNNKYYLLQIIIVYVIFCLKLKTHDNKIYYNWNG